MIIAELIKVLLQLPQDANIEYWDYEYDRSDINIIRTKDQQSPEYWKSEEVDYYFVCPSASSISMDEEDDL